MVILDMQYVHALSHLADEWGICLASERKMRARAVALVEDNLEAGAVLFTFPLKSGGEEIRAAAMAYVPELVGKVFEISRC